MKKKTRSLSINFKILLTTSLLMVCLILFLGISFYNNMEESMVSMGVEQARIAARVAVSRIDASVAALEPGDEGSTGYQEAIDALRDVKRTCSVAFLYTLYTDGKNVYYGVDTDETGAQNAIGVVFEESYAELQPVFQGNPYVQDYIDSTQDGDLISVYLPIQDGSGRGRRRPGQRL